MGMVGHRFWVMPWVWVCAMVFVGLVVVDHRFYGFMGHACHGVCVVGHRRCVRPWVWVAVDFIFVVVGRFSWVVVG